MKLNRVHHKNETKQWIKEISFNRKGGRGEEECQSKKDKTAWKNWWAHLSTCQYVSSLTNVSLSVFSQDKKSWDLTASTIFCHFDKWTFVHSPIKHEILLLSPFTPVHAYCPYIFYHLLTSSTPCFFCFWKLVSKSILLLQITSW